MDLPKDYDQEIERQHEPAVVLADSREPEPFDEVFYPRSECCGALMVNGGVQCLSCGSDGRVDNLSSCCGWPITDDMRCSKCKENI